ncbi:MAG TPA: hypothetical protein VGM52_19365 [Herbaspirillum sp.]|jgi:hypothetical protein
MKHYKYGINLPYAGNAAQEASPPGQNARKMRDVVFCVSLFTM